MKYFFKKLLFKLYLTYHSIMINIGMMLSRSEAQVFVGEGNELDSNHTITQRMPFKNKTLEEFYQGKLSEQTIQDYYEILKKADIFIKESTPLKLATTADKLSMNWSRDINPDRVDPNDPTKGDYLEYLGYDRMHKHYGLTQAEAEKKLYKEIGTKDTNYELIQIYNNKPIEKGLGEDDSYIETVDGNYIGLDTLQKALKRKFPLIVVRDSENVVNKIEQLAEFIHIRKIGMESVLLEFFIDKKYKIETVEENSEIFKELINIKQIWIKDNYGDLQGFKIDTYKDKLSFSDLYYIYRFYADNIIKVN